MKTRIVTLILAAALLGGCTGFHVRQGDKVARVGDWETALVQYRLAVEANPDDTVAKRKLWRAEKKVVELWTKRGNRANREGRLGDAGTWWRKAIELTHELERRDSDAWRAIQKNATALEYHGDVAFGEQRYEEALGTWGAVLLVLPDKMELVEKNAEAQRAFAAELHAVALGLAKRDLLGAALVTDLRALQYDPLQDGAFSAGSDLRRTIRSRTRIAIQEIKLQDGGYKGLAAPLLARLVPHMEDYPPYGPTKDGNAMRAKFVVTIEDFSRNEEVREGKDELPNEEPPSTVPIPNPAIPEQEKKVAELEKQLATAKKELKKEVAKRRRGAPQGFGADRGLELARKVDETKQALAGAKRVLAQLPAKVPPPPPAPTWTLPWKETTRTVTARVRFEITEPDFPDPVVLTLNETVSRTDRWHKGNARRGVASDRLELPSYEVMVKELAKKLEHGNSVVSDARQRRVDTLIERGREHLLEQRESEALDAFVAVLFLMGPQALPEDAAAFVAGRLEHDRFKDIVAMQ